MKIAVLSDIHGNLIALEEVLKDAKKQEVDEYIVLGDLITDFPMTNEVVDIIKELTPYVIKGNRENYLLKYEETKQDTKWNNIQSSNFKIYYNELRKDNLEYIKNLPDTMSLEFEKIKIKCIHGCINGVEYSGLKDKFNFDEDILVYGHEHTIAKAQKQKDKTIIQVGTIGMHNNEINKPQYTILNLENGQVSIEYRTVEYDKKILKNKIKENKIDENIKIWLNLCYYAIATGNDIRTEFTLRGKKLMDEKYRGRRQESLDSHFIAIDDDIYLKVAKEYEKYFLI